MALRKEVQRIIGGTLNLLAPVDKISDSDALDLTNWRVDQNNQLRTRLGSIKQDGPRGTGIIHSLGRIGDAEYAGIGTELHSAFAGGTFNTPGSPITGFDGEPLGIAQYQGSSWVMNRFKQIRWLAYLAIGPTKWGIVAPVNPPVATGGGKLSKILEPHDGTSGANTLYVSAPNLPNDTSSIAMIDDVSTPSASNPSYVTPSQAVSSDAVIAQGVHSLAIDVHQACTIQDLIAPGGLTSLTGVLNTSLTGLVREDDIFHFYFRFSDPSQIESLSIRLEDGVGGWVECDFSASPGQAGAFLPPSKYLAQSTNSFMDLQIKRTVNLDDWAAKISAAVAGGIQQNISDIEAEYAKAVTSPAFSYIGTGPAQTGLPTPPVSNSRLPINWSAIRKVRITMVVDAACEILMGPIEVTGSISANLAGAIQYFVSYANAKDEDSNPSPISNAVLAGNESITLTQIPVSTDPQVTQRWIYRIGGGLSQALLVGKILNNVSTGPWADTTSNDQAQADALESMPIDRDLPPPATGLIGPYLGKLIAFSSRAHPARYWWTPSAHPWYFPGSDDDFVGNWEDVGQDDDPLIQMTDHKQILVMYKSRSIWRVRGDPDNPLVFAERSNANVGIVGARAVVNAGSVDYFVGAEGVYRFNLDFEEKVSRALDPIFKGDVVVISESESFPPIEPSAMRYCCLALSNGRLRFSYPERGQPFPNVVVVLNLETGQWAREVYQFLAAPAFTVMTYEGQGQRLLAGATVGLNSGAYIYQLEQRVNTDAGQPINEQWQTRYFDQGLPDNFKWYSDIEVEFQTAVESENAGTLRVSAYFDDGTLVPLGTISSPTRTKQIFRLRDIGNIPFDPGIGPDYGRRAYNVSIRVERASPSELSTCIIYGVYIHWYAEERVALTFDTGFTHFGIPERAKQVDYIEIYMTAQGQMLQRIFSSDLPGSLLTMRDKATFQAPNGRGNVRFRLPAVREGRNFRMTIEAVCP